MALDAIKQFHGKAFEWGLRQSYFVEPYKVTGLSGDPYQIINAFPIRGSPHPLGAAVDNAVLERVRLVQWLNKDTALVALVYRRELTGYSGGPRPLSRISTRTETIQIPVIKSDGLGPPGYFLSPIPFSRAVSIRAETRFITGETLDVIQQRIAENTGCVYNLSGGPYIFIGADAGTDGRGRVRTTYLFETQAAIMPIPVGAPGIGNAIAIPALPRLHKYVTDTAVYPPTVSVAPIASLALAPVSQLIGL